MHAVEYAAALQLIEAVEQEGLQEAPALRLAGGQRAVDGAAQRIGSAGAVGPAMRQEIRSVAHDGKANALDEAGFAIAAGEGRQLGALAQLPGNFGEAEATILEEARALGQRAG